MFLYLDASALVKRYMVEAGSAEVNQASADAETNGTVTITRVEVAAALAKAVRIGALEQMVALSNLHKFRNEWHDLNRIQVTNNLVTRADALAWEHNLRGYDAVHLAAALVWQEGLGEAVTMATFDEQLWQAAEKERLACFPDDLSRYTKAKHKTA